jgi:hypothetical protein
LNYYYYIYVEEIYNLTGRFSLHMRNQSHAFCGLCSSSGIVSNYCCNIPKPGSVSYLQLRVRGSLLCWVPQKPTALMKCLILEVGSRSSCRKVVFSTRNFGQWTKSINPVILSVIPPWSEIFRFLRVLRAVTRLSSSVWWTAILSCDFVGS